MLAPTLNKLIIIIIIIIYLIQTALIHTNETERNVSSRSRVNTCKILFLSGTVPYRSVPFRFVLV